MAMRGDARMNTLSVNAVLCIEALTFNMASLTVSTCYALGGSSAGQQLVLCEGYLPLLGVIVAMPYDVFFFRWTMHLHFNNTLVNA